MYVPHLQQLKCAYFFSMANMHTLSSNLVPKCMWRFIIAWYFLTAYCAVNPEIEQNCEVKSFPSEKNIKWDKVCGWL